VTLDQIPADLTSPWTIEIGDSSETVSATFGPAPVVPVEVGPVVTPVLTSSTDSLIVQMQRQPGDTTPTSARATLTNSAGQSDGQFAQISESSLAFPYAVSSGWPPGPISVEIALDYFSADQLLDCQAPQCTLTPGSGVDFPAMAGPFTVQLTCQTSNGRCG
jgi:hypothetical protein